MYAGTGRRAMTQPVGDRILEIAILKIARQQPGTARAVHRHGANQEHRILPQEKLRPAPLYLMMSLSTSI